MKQESSAVILAGMATPGFDFEEDLEIRTAWEAEIQRRIRELDEGVIETIPAEEVFADLRARFEKTNSVSSERTPRSIIASRDVL